jgi:hypothetical protein
MVLISGLNLSILAVLAASATFEPQNPSFWLSNFFRQYRCLFRQKYPLRTRYILKMYSGTRKRSIMGVNYQKLVNTFPRKRVRHPKHPDKAYKTTRITPILGLILVGANTPLVYQYFLTLITGSNHISGPLPLSHIQIHQNLLCVRSSRPSSASLL